MKRELLSLVLTGALIVPTLSWAQAGSKATRRPATTSGDQDRDQTRDRLKDASCSTCPGCPTSSVFVSSDQTKDQLHDRTQDLDKDQLRDPDQLKTKDQIKLHQR